MIFFMWVVALSAAAGCVGIVALLYVLFAPEDPE